MRTVTRLAGYAALLAVVFASMWGLGTLVGPLELDSTPNAAAADADHSGHSPDQPTEQGHDHDSPESYGLTSTVAGYTLTTVPGAEPDALAFTVNRPDGHPVTEFADPGVLLAVVRRDGTEFRQLHATADRDGVWRAPVTFATPGSYRVLADVTPADGPRIVLGTDLYVPGAGPPAAAPTPSRVWQADGYQVRLDGDLVPGTSSQVFATISHDGQAVTDLEPYLGAFGHLVVLRTDDLALLPVRSGTPAPPATARSGPGVAFVVDVPSAGTYRLFLGFRTGGTVHTADFTVQARPS